ncbi:hypothetical protein E3P99_02589 [Wallemia hederae]|uniref:Cytochrome b-c1 complex subunit 8 n=1 Tax=Wallemia hederae TaxID=1540922 RepID=A0A4T0FLX8_9BASI|nr:hypothetical protein E3P99_02589 [Wallemia hederae]
MRASGIQNGGSVLGGVSSADAEQARRTWDGGVLLALQSSVELCNTVGSGLASSASTAPDSRYSGISAFQQRPFAGALNGYIFNGYKRLAKQLPYSGTAFALGYGVYYWASSKHEYLNSKAGHIEALKNGTAE